MPRRFIGGLAPSSRWSLRAHPLRGETESRTECDASMYQCESK